MGFLTREKKQKKTGLIPIKFTNIKVCQVQRLYVKSKEYNDNYQKQEQSTLAALEEVFHVYHISFTP
jgi:CRISPR/Cas system CSM-associated protein Csm3 (group 7 of RAMP superfamily)